MKKLIDYLLFLILMCCVGWYVVTFATKTHPVLPF